VRLGNFQALLGSQVEAEDLEQEHLLQVRLQKESELLEMVLACQAGTGLVEMEVQPKNLVVQVFAVDMRPEGSQYLEGEGLVQMDCLSKVGCKQCYEQAENSSQYVRGLLDCLRLELGPARV
jgi:hypothetical protein